MRIKHMKNSNTSNNRNISTKVKVITAFILGLVVSGGAAYAATILFNADQVGFDNTNTSLSSTDVQGALDELYERSKSIWVDPSKVGETMQNFDKTKLPDTGNTTVLRDTRDGNTYVVRKLADGNVWMTQNLRIANKTITSADSNVTSDFTIPASSITGFVAPDTNHAYVDSTYGGYYTFYTATAGWGTSSVASGSSPSSICPKGWRLPTSTEFKTLYTNYNSASAMMGDPGFVLSGRVYNGSVVGQGDDGRYWSRKVRNASGAYNLLLDSSNVTPEGSNGKYVGFSVRCIAQ